MIAAAILLWTAAGQANAANLIVNGGFATPNVFPGDGFFSSIPGWTVNQDSIELDYTPILGMACYDADCQSAEVNANTFDTVSQTVTGLSIGQSYTLSWGYGDRPGSGPQQLDVSFGGAPITSDFGNGFTGVWTTNTFTVTATATSEILSFAAVDTSGIGGGPSVGNEIDGVSLCAIGSPCTNAPEPASMALLGAGVIGLGFWRRRR